MAQVPNQRTEPSSWGGSLRRPLGALLLAVAFIVGNAALSSLRSTDGPQMRGDIDEDECAFRIGREMVLFSAYQPDRGGGANERLCRRLPELNGRTILVFDIVNHGFRSTPLEVAVVPAAVNQTKEVDELRKNAVVRRSVDGVPSGTLSVEHDFSESPPGKYKALLMAGHETVAIGEFVFEIGGGKVSPIFGQGGLLIAVVLLTAGLFLLIPRRSGA